MGYGNRLLDMLMALGKGRTVLVGSFAPNAASAIDQTKVYGDTGWSVVRTNTGLFTVTLDNAWQYVLSGWAHLGLASGDDKIAQFGAMDPTNATPASRTAVIRIWDIGSAAVADVSADANNRVFFGLVVKASLSGGKR